MSEENQLLLDDTPKSRQAVNEIFSDEEEKKALTALLASAQRTLADEGADTKDINTARGIIKEFLQLKHGKVEKDIPHFKISVTDVFGNFIDVGVDQGKVTMGGSGKPRIDKHQTRTYKARPISDQVPDPSQPPTRKKVFKIVRLTKTTQGKRLKDNVVQPPDPV